MPERNRMCSMKRPSINLSLFINNISESFSSDTKSPSNSSKSPRNFDGGVVGLGIVAAMSDTGVARTGFSSRSQPIAIVLPKPTFVKFRETPVLEKDDDESYTCVISHLGKKREHFDEGNCKPGVFFTSPLKNTHEEATTLFQASDFLNYCYLCRKKLHGLDIFMYRGDKAFCSAECRYKQILSDEHRAKCGSGKLKSFAYSVSPCSAPRIFSTGVAAA